MSRTLKALSALLTYPTTELQGGAAEIGLALAEDGLLRGTKSTASSYTRPKSKTTEAPWSRALRCASS